MYGRQIEIMEETPPASMSATIYIDFDIQQGGWNHGLGSDLQEVVC
jgi:hypothetical protein